VVKNNVPPNFMFMIDDSGSMSNIVPGAPYDKAVNYTPAGCTALGNTTLIELYVNSGVPFIRVGNNDYRHSTATSGSSSTKRCFTRTTIYSAKLLANSGGVPGGYLDASYDGNFLNWYFGNAGGQPVTGWTDRKKVNTGSVQTRLDIAKASSTTVLTTQLNVSNPAGVRVGLSAYNGDNGGALKVGMADFTTTQRTTMTTAIAALTAANSTP
jgi:type IV pilus assembly protein PilY1